MAKFLAVVVGAAIGLGVVWFLVIQPRQGLQPPAAPSAASAESGASGAVVRVPEGREVVPRPAALTEAEVAAAVELLASDDDVVRGSAIEQWGTVVSVAEGDVAALALQPGLVAALRARMEGMPPDRLSAYVEAWGPEQWWVESFPVAHARHAAWRAGADDAIWVPYAYDQLDRFDPEADKESIRAIIDVLVRSSFRRVRVRSLESAAHYFGEESRAYALGMRADPEEFVSRLAWLIVAKTGGADDIAFEWSTGPRWVGEAVLYTLALHDPEEARSVCDFLDRDPVLMGWYGELTPLIRQRASGSTDREPIVSINPGYGPARVFEEAIRVDELLSGNYPHYVQE